MRPHPLLLVVPIFFACSCNPKLGIEAGPSFHAPLPAGSECVVLGAGDTIRVKGDEVVELSYLQQRYSSAWAPSEVARYFQTEALHNGGNLVKITKYQPVDYRQMEKVLATVYRVDDIRHYEKQIEWSPDRKLELSDFKGPPAEIHPGAQVTPKSYSGCDFYLFSRAKFYCYYGWIDSSSEDPTRLLLHEQGNFDLCEIYRRQLDENVIRNESGSSSRDQKTTETIFQIVYTAYVAKQAQYEAETSHGSDSAKQAEWTKRIAAEIANGGAGHDRLFTVNISLASPQKESAIPQPPPGKALVYIIRPKNISTPLPERVLFRPEFLLLVAPYGYFVNLNQYTIDYKDSTTGPLMARSYTYLVLDPDHYTFRPTMNKGMEARPLFIKHHIGKIDSLELSLAAGKVYYLRLTTGETWFAFSKPRLQVLDEKEGIALLRKCHYEMDDLPIELPQLINPLE